MKIMKPLVCGIALALSSTVSFAAGAPNQSPLDSRIQYFDYTQGQVYKVYGSVNADTWIVFEEGEKIMKATAAKPQGWTITADGRILTLQPHAVGGIEPEPKMWDTNINVMTSTGRFYTLFASVGAVSGRSPDQVAAFMVHFNYPATVALAKKQVVDAEEKFASRCDQDTTDFIDYSSSSYTISEHKSTADIRPELVFDDGTYTYMVFPKGKLMPTFFSVGSDGGLSSMNSHEGTFIPHNKSVDGRMRILQGGCGDVDTAVIHGISDKMVLKNGKMKINVDKVKK